MAAAFRLKCQKCGATTTSSRRDRRCKQIAERVVGLQSPTQVYCWGMLQRVDKRAKRQQTDLDKAAHCEQQLALATTRMKRAVTSMELWARRRAYYLKKAEGMIKRTPRDAKPKKDRHSRAIVLPTDE